MGRGPTRGELARRWLESVASGCNSGARGVPRRPGWRCKANSAPLAPRFDNRLPSHAPTFPTPGRADPSRTVRELRRRNGHFGASHAKHALREDLPAPHSSVDFATCVLLIVVNIRGSGPKVLVIHRRFVHHIAQCALLRIIILDSPLAGRNPWRRVYAHPAEYSLAVLVHSATTFAPNASGLPYALAWATSGAGFRAVRWAPPCAVDPWTAPAHAERLPAGRALLATCRWKRREC